MTFPNILGAIKMKTGMSDVFLHTNEPVTIFEYLP